MRHRSHVLHTLLEGFVLRRGQKILRDSLLPKFEHVLFLRPSPVQEVLYNYVMDQIKNGPSATTAGPLKAFAMCSKVREKPCMLQYTGICLLAVYKLLFVYSQYTSTPYICLLTVYKPLMLLFTVLIFVSQLLLLLSELLFVYSLLTICTSYTDCPMYMS